MPVHSFRLPGYHLLAIKIHICASTTSQARGWPLETQRRTRQCCPHGTSGVVRRFSILDMHTTPGGRSCPWTPPLISSLGVSGKENVFEAPSRLLVHSQCGEPLSGLNLFSSLPPVLPRHQIRFFPFLPFAPGRQHSVRFLIHSLVF